MDTAFKQLIKGYEMHERIGAGGFGAVYKAYQSTVGREVAIKIILPGLSNHPDFIRRFESEAQLVARLEHPHITPLYDYWRDPEGAYLVMRWLRGGSLRDALQNGPFELRLAALILDQIASALSLAHRNGIIHRDIKPGNILLDEDGNAYLTDFGIAKDLNLATQNTQQETIVGSLDYISPEQARSEPVTPRADIYSLGITLYETITGHHPFENMSSVERLYKHINDPLPYIEDIEAGSGIEINRVIQKATAKNPEQRYPDALALAADFRQAIGLKRNSTNVEELLTQREHELLQMIIEGMSNKEIAQRLTITLGTVKWHVNQIYGKLGVRSRVQAIIRARELNLIAKPGEMIGSISIPTEDFHPQNPYKGLLAFQSADHQDFFGREKLIAKLINRLSDNGDYKRFLAIVGPSGSGKSSLVRAGVIPALWRGDLPGAEKWFVVDMMPGSHPIDELEVALTRVAANQTSTLNEQLRRDNRGLIRAAGLILPNDGTELMVIIDQFEELFTLVADEPERLQFLDLLYNAVIETRSRVRVVITLRADFYDRPLHYPQFGELVRTRLETIMPLSAEELDRAISRPAERVGVTFEQGLVSAIIGDVNYQPGVLPLLQYALTELFEQRKGRVLTREAYQAIGGTIGALAKRAEEVYLNLGVESQEITRQIFLRLVTISDSIEETRRRTARSELRAVTQDTELLDEIIDTFVSYRLLSLDTDPATRSPTVEVAHEALLREWERLRSWLNESRDDIKLQRQLANAAIEWEQSGRELSFLMSGSRLTTLAKWSSESKISLTEKERYYLQESIKEQQRQQATETERQARVTALEQRSVRFLRILVAVLLIAVLGAFGLTGAAVSQSNLTEQALTTSDANFRHAEQVRLAAQAQNLINDGSPGNLPVLLALSSLRFGYSEQGDAALLKASSLGIIKRHFSSTSIAVAGTFSPDGKTAVTVGADHLGHVWDVETGAKLLDLEGASDLLNLVVFAPNGRYIVSAGLESSLWMWDAQSGNLIHQLSGFEGQSWSIAISPDSTLIVSGTSDKTLRIWDAQSGKETHRILDINAVVAFSPDGKYLLTGSDDTVARLWDTNTWNEIRQYSGHTATIESVTFSPDGNTFATASDDKTLRLWDTQTGTEIRQFVGHTSIVATLDFSPDGRILVSGGIDQTIRFWDVENGNELKQFYSRDTVTSVDYSPDGKYVLSNGQPDALLWDAQFKSEPQIIHVTNPTQDGGPWHIKYSFDRRYLLTSGPQSAQIWDAQTMQIIYTLELKKSIRDGALSPNGKLIFASTDGPDTNAYLYEVANGKTIQTFKGHSALINEVDYSPDGKYVSTSSMDNTAIVWDVQTGKIVHRFEGHTAALGHSIFSSDSQRLLTSSTDGTLRLWDISSGKLLQVFSDNAAGVMNVAFAPDEKRIASNHFDGTFRIWDVQTGSVLHTLTGYSGMTWGSCFPRMDVTF
ncbi:MAG: protein kinase [Anaerolineae bacterium]|nr:protein kinase [Anaerolineae bacterium]